MEVIVIASGDSVFSVPASSKVGEEQLRAACASQHYKLTWDH